MKRVIISVLKRNTYSLLCQQAPVSGSKKPAEDGKLIFLTAGKESCFTFVTEKPNTFSIFSKKILLHISHNSETLPGDESLYKTAAPFLDLMGKVIPRFSLIQLLFYKSLDDFFCSHMFLPLF